MPGRYDAMVFCFLVLKDDLLVLISLIGMKTTSTIIARQLTYQSINVLGQRSYLVVIFFILPAYAAGLNVNKTVLLVGLQYLFQVLWSQERDITYQTNKSRHQILPTNNKNKTELFATSSNRLFDKTSSTLDLSA